MKQIVTSEQKYRRSEALAADVPVGMFFPVAAKLLDNQPPSAVTAYLIAASMFRAGLLVCERRSPLSYYDFVSGVFHFVFNERMEGTLKYQRWTWKDVELCYSGHFEAAALNMLLDSDKNMVPRGIAFALVNDAFLYCSDNAPYFYDEFVAIAQDFLYQFAFPHADTFPSKIEWYE